MGDGVAAVTLARGQGDDLRHPAVPDGRPVRRRGGFQMQLDDDVDTVRDRPGRVLGGDVRPGLHRTRHQLPHRTLGVGRVGGRDRAGAGLHRLQHGDDLRAADLTDDLPGQGEPERVVQRVGQGEFAGLPAVRAAFPRPRPGLPRQRQRIPVRHLVQMQLVLGFERADRLMSADLGTQRPHQRRLPRRLRPGDHNRLPRPHRRGQKRRRQRRQRAQPDQIREGDPLQPVAADHHRRPRRHPRRRRQPRTAVQPQMQPRGSGAERAGVHLRPGRQEDQEVDQILITVRDRIRRDDRPVDQLEPDLVETVDGDVLHPVVIHQRLQPAQPEQRVEHRRRRRLLHTQRRRLTARRQRRLPPQPPTAPR